MALIAARVAVTLDAQSPTSVPIAGPNVNMVSGTTLPNGDPFLQRQNEPSGAVSTRNPLHLLAGANDYRTVDMPGIADDDEAKGDAWLGVFKSFDGGQTWRSTLIPGYPADKSAAGTASPLHGFAAGADPTVRAGTNGLFYYTGIAFNRGDNGLSVVFVSRFIDNNNVPGGDPIAYLDTQALDSGTAGKFLDKPALAVDIPRAGAATCSIQAPGAATQQFPAGNVYVAHTVALGNDKNPVTALMVTRSTDCGATWSKPIKISERVHVNQGATMAIDPNTGALYVAWREIADTNAPDSIVMLKSTDGGKTFTKADVVTQITPFDQGTTVGSFRTRAYPTMAVDGAGRVYIAWAERAWGPSWTTSAGAIVPHRDARIVMKTSIDGGTTWSALQPIDNHDSPGHQIMPAMTITGGKVAVIFYDFRDDVSGAFQSYIVDYTGIAKRHTMDVRVAQTDPAAAPQFGPSVKVSQYLTGFRPGTHTREQLQFNPPNLPLYSQGEKAFIGDYLDVAGLMFVKNANGQWAFNTSASGSDVRYAFWTDNRDVRPPLKGHTWKDYTPPAVLNPFSGALEVCSPGQTGMRNANIYTSRISQGLVVGAPTNSKRLGGVLKSFVVFAQNSTGQERRYRFTIANQPLGGKASFLQFPQPGQADPLTTLDVTIAPRSTVSRVVYVTASDSTGSVSVNVSEIPNPKQPNQPLLGLQEWVVLNPDVTNPDVTNPDVTNKEIFNPDVTNPDVTNPVVNYLVISPDVTNPDVTNPDVTNVANPDVTNPDVTNPDVTNPDVTNVSLANPDVTNPDVTNPDVTNPDVTNPDVTNPDVTNPDVTNPSLSDVSWTIKNKGTSAGSFAVMPFVTKNKPAGFITQLILHKLYTTPITTNTGTNDCQIKTQTQNVVLTNIINPDVMNSDGLNPDATLVLEPGQSARITVRVVNPNKAGVRPGRPGPYPEVTKTITGSVGQTETVVVPQVFDTTQNVGSAIVSESANTGETTPPSVVTIAIDQTALPSGGVGQPYSTTLTATGGVIGGTTWSITAGSLPPGLSLSAATGLISGTPTSGTANGSPFFFTVQVADTAVPAHINTRDLSILINNRPTADPKVVSTNEDTGVSIALSGGDVETPPAALLFTVIVQPTHGTLSSTSASGAAPSITYTPAGNYNGADGFVYVSTDAGSPSGCGPPTSTCAAPVTSVPATVSITVAPVNDAPTVAQAIAPVQVNEDAADSTIQLAQTFADADIATNADVLTLSVSGNTNPSLVTATIDPATKTLTLHYATNQNGTASITVRATDTANAFVETVVAVTVVAVNDAPSFTVGLNQTVLSSAGPQTVPGWATSISAGPNESSQTVDFIVTNDNTALFSAQPAVDANGTLTFTPAANANGSATVTVQIHDNGGTANSGVDTSAPQTFTIFVNAPLDVTTLREGVVLENQPALPIVGGNGTRAVTLTSGSLPPGLTLTSTGGFTGSPTRHGTFNFTVQIQDCTPASTCGSGTVPQIVTKPLTLRVSAKDQQGSGQTQPSISFGGPGGRKFAQVVTVGAQGTLTGIGLQNISCPFLGPVTVEIQRLTLAGLPDGVTIASGTALNNLNGAIAVAPVVELPIDSRFAFVISSPTSCNITAARVDDNGYEAGDAYVNSGGGWVSLFSTDGRYDIPFRTLIQPAMDIAYLNQFRSFDKAALLDNAALANYGKVLLTGNNNTAELYDPSTNTLTQTGNMSVSRQEHTATVLTDGTVLIAGGRDSSNVRLATAEIYDPSTGTFSPTAGSMTVAREQYAATRLNNGTVLLTGGLNTSGSAVSSAEIYNPVTKTFSSTGSMTTNRQDHAAVLLPSGKVLIAGGYNNSSNRSTELYDPGTGTFAPTAGQMVVRSRGRVTATLLLDGTVLLTGGQSGDIQNSAEIYNPTTDTFSLTTGAMASKRYLHTATLLTDGSVLVAGGYDQQSSQSYVLPLATLERYVPATGTFVPAGSMETRHVAHTATRLLNNKVFLAGGSSQSWMTGDTGELYDVSAAPALTTTALPDGQIGVPYAGATLAASGGGGPPYQIAQVSGVLPPGITYDASTFTFSTTSPTQDGLFPVGFRVTDVASHSNTQTLSIRVGTGVVITSPYVLTSGAVNHVYSYQLTATGTNPIVWSLAPASSMPAGLSVISTGLISGTPTTTGGTNFAIRAVDATGQVAVKTFNINIQNPLVITTTSLGDGVLFEGYGGCLNANNGVGTRTWTYTGSLPPGVSLSTGGCFSGSPTSFGTFNFTVQVTDQSSPPQVDSKALSIRVFARPVVNGDSYSVVKGHTLTVAAPGVLANDTDADTPTSSLTAQYVPGSGPSNGTLTFNTDGSFSYTPNANFTGSDSFRYTASDGVRTSNGQATVNINVLQPLTITTTSLTQGVALEIYGSPVNATGGSGPRTWTLTGTNGANQPLFQTPIVPGPTGWTSPGGTFPLGQIFAASTPNSSSSFGSFALGQAQPRQAGDFPVTITVSDDSGSASKDFLLRLFAVDQQPNSGSPGSTVTVASGAPVAQTVTVGAAGSLNAVRFPTLASCSNLTVQIKRALASNGAPDESPGANLATVTAVNVTSSNQIIPLPSPLYFTPDEQFAIVLTTPGSCQIQNAATTDNYVDGAAWVNSGGPGAWAAIPGGVADIPVHTLIQYNSNANYATQGPIFLSDSGRSQTRSVTLNDGRVLIVPSSGTIPNGSNGPTAELFDPAHPENATTATPPMMARRNDATVTLLADGRVLVVGGSIFNSQTQTTTYLSSAEIYDPVANTWTATGSMNTARSQHQATRLSDGRVLVTGGQSTSSTLQSAEIYNPASGWSCCWTMVAPRNQHQATLLADGRVLITGGFSAGNVSAEVYDSSQPPATVFRSTGAMAQFRASHTATLLGNGKVLIAGGQIANGPPGMATHGELYTPAADPANATFSDAGALVYPRSRHIATLLADGTSVLLAGGQRNSAGIGAPWAAAELYTGSGFQGAPSLNVTRSDLGAVLLGTGQMVIGGGTTGSGGSRQAGQTLEFYDPGNLANGTPSIANATLPNGSKDVTYSTTSLIGTGGTAPYSFAVVSGALPPGITLTNGTIAGTPTAYGSYSFGVRITDSLAHASVETLTIAVNGLAITTSSLPNAYRNRAYSATLTATGIGSKTWSLFSSQFVTGAPPSGLTVNADGTITGTPSPSAQGSNFTVKVVDSLGQTAYRQLSISVFDPIAITTTSLNPGVALETYSSPVSSSGGGGPRTWTLTGANQPLFYMPVGSTVPQLPPGTTLPLGQMFAASSVFNGLDPATSFGSFALGQAQPRQTGDFPVTITVSDDSGSDSRNFTLRAFAVDQQPNSEVPGATVTVNSGMRIAQTVTVGAAGSLTAVRFPTINQCSNATIAIEGVQAASGAPDDLNVLSTVSGVNITFGNQIIPLTSPLYFTPDERFAIVLSTTGSCQIPNAATTDRYRLGAAWANAGGGWTSVSGGVADISVHTLIQNSSLTYLADSSRGQTRAVRLNDGRVLVVPSSASIPNGTNGPMAEVFDPAHPENATAVTPAMKALRRDFTATLLSDGKVLVVGGSVSPFGQPTTYLNTAEIYDPVANTWTATGSMTTARSQHQATRLSDGRVLVTGGQSASSTLQNAEIYASGTWSPGGTMVAPRNQHQATLLADGRVLITGGFSAGNISAEVYDASQPPATVFRSTGAMAQFRASHTATLLGNGKVLIAGGQIANGPPGMATHGELYTPAPDPANGAFSDAGLLVYPRSRHTATLLGDGASVLLAGGQRDSGSIGAPWAVAEVYSNDGFQSAASLNVTRNDQGAALLTSGRIAIAGGNSVSGASRQTGQTLEVYDPDTSATGTPTIANANLPDGSRNVTYPTIALAVKGGTGLYTFTREAGDMPPGISLDSNGNISGTPTAYGSYYFGVKVNDSGNPQHSSTTTLLIRVNGLDITTTSLPQGYVSHPYAGSISATGVGAKTYSVYSFPGNSDSLPNGLTLNADGTITGTPTTLQYSQFTVKAVDSIGQTAYRQLSISVFDPITITTTSLAEGILSWGYPGCLNWTGASEGSKTFSVVSGSLPPGITLNSGNGCFTGSPTALGTFNFTAQISDQSSPPQVVTKVLSIHVSAPDQQVYANGPLGSLSFGDLGPVNQRSLAQTFTAGASGMLTAVSFYLTCPSNSTTVTLQIQGVTPASFLPDGNVLASGTGPWYWPIALSSPRYFAKGERFAVVLSAADACSMNNLASNDNYLLGEGYERNGNGSWQRLSDTEGKADLNATTVIVPSANLAFLSAWRSNLTATRLTCPVNNTTCAWGGKVLVTGGDNTAELYDPATHTTTSTGSMATARFNHTATLLNDGTVLVVGGSVTTWNDVSATAATYDPATGAFTATNGNLLTARGVHTATLLNDGRVLIAGGQGANGESLQSAELYDPVPRAFSAVSASMIGTRSQHTATLLGDGKVLLAGGNSSGPWPVPDAELYDPTADSFAAISGPIHPLRARHTATLLNDGRVLLAGGFRYPDAEAVAEIYDPQTNTLSATGAMITARGDLAATRLADGTVLLAGGVTTPNWPNEPIDSIERFDPGAGTFSLAGAMAVNRTTERAVTLLDGRVLLVGGYSSSWLSTRSGELYDPSTALVISPPQLPVASLDPLAPPYNAQLSSSGGTAPRTLTLASGALPDGLGFAAGPGTGTATIGGTPAVRGVFPLAVQVADSGGHVAVQSYSLRVSALTITSPFQLTDGTVGQSYSYQLTAANNDGAVVWLLDSGQSLPPNFTLSSGGLISGTPASHNYYQFVVVARDASGQTALKTLSLNVPNHTPVANGSSVTVASGVPTNVFMAGTDADGDALTFAITASPQHGTLSAVTAVSALVAKVTYTPTVPYNGADSFSFSVNDGSNISSPAAVAITVTTPTFITALGGFGTDTPYAVARTLDGGYVFVGDTWSFDSNPDVAVSNARRIWVVRMDAFGSIVWQKRLTNPAGYLGSATHAGGEFGKVGVAGLSDGGFAVAGTAMDTATNHFTPFIAKLDSGGAIVWQQTMAGTADDSLTAVVQASNGDLLAAGNTLTWSVSGSVDAWVARIDQSNGTVIWQKSYGLGASDDYVSNITTTADGGFALTGWSYSIGSASNAWALKADSNGTIASGWPQDLGDGGSGSFEIGRAIAQTGDGGYVIAGQAFGATRVIKLGAAGWDGVYSLVASQAEGIAVNGNDIFVAGRQIVSGISYLTILKLDAINGSVVWSNQYRSGWYATSIVATADGGALAVGVGSGASQNGDAFVVKVDAVGNVNVPACSASVTSISNAKASTGVTPTAIGSSTATTGPGTISSPSASSQDTVAVVAQCP